MAIIDKGKMKSFQEVRTDLDFENSDTFWVVTRKRFFLEMF